MSTDYLKRILTSKVYDVALETPLEVAPHLSARLTNTVWLKREDTQPVFSFKLRGAYNKMAHLSASALARGVIASSAGNHAQGVALSARKLGCRAVIVMPTTTPPVKIDAVRLLGAEVVLHGDSYSDAFDKATELQAIEQLTFVHPFDDPDVIAGQGTVAMEILRQQQGPLDAIFVPVGGGGLIAGVAAYVKYLRPEVRIIGVEPEGSSCLLAALRAGERVVLPSVDGFADGTAVAQVGAYGFEICRDLVDEVITVSNDQLCSAIKLIYDDTRSITEPSGALAVAGLREYVTSHNLRGQTLVAINSGANINFDSLRYVAERVAAQGAV